MFVRSFIWMSEVLRQPIKSLNALSAQHVKGSKAELTSSLEAWSRMLTLQVIDRRIPNMAESELSGNIDMSVSTSIAPSSYYGKLKTWLAEKRSKIRPWSEFLDTKRFSKPNTSAEVAKRLTKNVEIYQANYVFIFLGLAAYCILTSPLLLIALSISGGATWYINYKSNSKPVSIFGRQFSLAEQYGLIALICLPLFFLASAGSTVFWIIGASFFVIALHASLIAVSSSAELTAGV